MTSSALRSARHAESGFALLAVLVALSILLALTAPFLTSMGNGAEVARQLGSDTKADLASVSVRDYLLAQAALATGDPSRFQFDETPFSDAESEFPADLDDLPTAFAPLRDSGRNLLGGEVEDEQRRFDLNSATPLLLGNLIGTTTFLEERLLEDAEEIVVTDASGFPEQGFLFVEHECIRYGARTDQAFTDLQRGLLTERGFRIPTDHEPREQSLVLDMRCVLASAWPFTKTGDPSQREPYTAVGQLAELSDFGFGAFEPWQIDTFERVGTARGFAPEATTWGQGSRVFRILQNRQGQNIDLVTGPSVTFGGGTMVRIRSSDDQIVEYNMVWKVDQSGAPPYNLRGNRLRLLWPLGGGFQAEETLVEPLVPVPLNANTAAPELLAALFANLAAERRQDGPTGPRVVTTILRAGEADALVAAMLQPSDVGDTQRPYDGLQDFIERFWSRQMDPAVVGPDRRELNRRVGEMLLHGATPGLKATTLPVTFSSGPLVRYRAAAARTRITGIEDARVERRGFALSMPDREVVTGATTQAGFEELTRFDRHSAFWTTGPIYVGIPHGAAEPPSRAFAQLMPYAYPGSGVGSPRFPDRGEKDAWLRPIPSSTPLTVNGFRLEAMSDSDDPEGRVLATQGIERWINNGPGPGGVPPVEAGRRAFPFSEGAGLVSQEAMSAWFKLDDLGDQGLFEIAGTNGQPDRNRISAEIIGGEFVLQVIPEAGVDPDPGLVNTQPQLPAATWRVPVADTGLQAQDWVHVSIGWVGNRPDQLQLLLDGRPFGEPDHVTELADGSAIPSAPIDYVRYAADPRSDRDRYLQIPVEDASTFPPQGVVRIGYELFEYTGISGNSLNCAFQDSFGGRAARTDNAFEFLEPVPQNPLSDLEVGQLFQAQGQGGNQGATLPVPGGARVELYGYSLPLYPRAGVPLQPGAAALTSAVGAFCVARVANANNEAEPIQPPGASLRIGEGLPAMGTQGLDLVLADPVANDQQDPGSLPEPSPLVTAAFPEDGAFVLLMQRRYRITGGPAGGGNQPQFFGGIECIRYARRQGNRLTGVERGIDLGHGQRWPNELRTSFVTNWQIVNGFGEDPNDFEQFYVFAIPISLRLSRPPLVSNHIEWVQIRAAGGGDDSTTEWVRYNDVRGNDILHNDVNRYVQCYNRLVGPAVDIAPGDPNNPNQPPQIQGRFQIVERDPAPPGPGPGTIGFTDEVEAEDGAGFRITFEARRILDFRGDPFTNTTSHAFAAGAQVLPVHRFEFSWRRMGLRAPRAGRLDRVALVAGSQRRDGNTPTVEWQTVNWVVRRYQGNGPPAQPRPPESILFGDFPFQLVAFQGPVQNVYTALNDVPSYQGGQIDDVRLLDRMVKYPSGERPAEEVTEVTIGSAPVGGGAQVRGIVDEVAAMPRNVLSRMLAQEVPIGGQQIVVRPDIVPVPEGVQVNGARPAQWRVGADFPQQGGMVRIGEELIAYRTYDPGTGTFSIAEDGRGMLGTEVQGHGAGQDVHFIEEIPVGILARGVSPRDHEFAVASLGGLPTGGGTVRVGRTELAHYAWSAGGLGPDQPSILGMPRWYPPEDPDDPGRRPQPEGLFRGRYGTVPISASGGSALVWQPFRRWDRYREGASDPETSFFQATFNRGPVVWKDFAWRETTGTDLVDMRAAVRFDRRGSWKDPAELNPFLMRFDEGRDAEGVPHRLDRLASRIEIRLGAVYQNGAFDPVLGQSHDWKRAPQIDELILTYEGVTRILEEEVTTR